MENKKNLNRKMRGGYFGLLALLIGVAIIIFLIFRTDLFSGKKDSKNMIEQGTGAINQAEEVKNIIENKQNQQDQNYEN